MTFSSFFFRLGRALGDNMITRVLFVAICADMLFGSLRAARERKWNSAVGIDGGIRKIAMVACVVLLTVVDMVIHADVLAWLPQEMQQFLSQIGMIKVGMCELFAVLFVLYEATSVLKNLMLCGVPIPAGVREKAERWLNQMTEEMHAVKNES